MSIDSFDAPPPADTDAPPDFRPGFAAPSDYVLKLANAIDRLASVLERLPSSSPGGALPPVPSPGPQSPGAPPGGSIDETQVKMSKKVFALCKQNNWDIAEVGQIATGRALGEDSRKWSKADLATVLDVMKTKWGVG